MEGGALDGRAAARPAVARDDTWTRWLPPLLWPGGDVWIGRGSPPGPRGSGRRFAVIPSARNPRLLVPLGPGRAAAAPFLGANEAVGAGDRVRRAAVAWTMATGLGNHAARDRLVVRGDDPLARALERAVGGEVTYAVHLGAGDRLNVKPVVLVIDGRGRTIGFAKVPRDALTAMLVANEERALEGWASSPPSSFDPPRILDRFDLGGIEVALVSALPQPLLRRPRPVPTAVFREIAERDGVTTEAFGESAYRSSLVRRLEGAHEDVVRVLDEVDRHAADRPMRFGGWHGDLAPWNLAWAGGRLMIWDWERAGGPVPVGFDVLHHRIAGGLGARDAGSYVRRAIADAAPVLVELGCDPADVATIAKLSVLERCARIRDAERTSRVGPRSWPFARAALAAV